MRFSTKIFLATSVVSCAGVAAASLSLFEISKNLYVHQYKQLYQERLELVAREFVALEELHEQLAGNAAKVAKELDQKTHGRISTAELTKLALDLNVDSIEIVKASGDVPSGLHQTPLLPDPKNPSVVAYFTSLANHDRTRVIKVEESFDEISKMLERLVNDSSDIVHVSVHAPSGTNLGEVGEKAVDAKTDSKLSVTVPASISDCPECRARALVTGNEPYTYRFDAEVSLKALHQVITDLEGHLTWILLVLLAFSLAVSAVVSKILLQKIRHIRATLDEIAKTGDFSKTIPVSANPGSKDELNALAIHFNRMFGSMTAAQAQLIEAKKTEARAAIASQVAHDIRSPLTSMTLAVNKLEGPAEMISILSHGISRVNGILKRLSKTYGKAQVEGGAPVEPPRLTLVDKILFEVAQEHALKIPSTQKFGIIGFSEVPSIWGVVQITELQTALSNILNNAFEAVGPNGKVELSLALEKNQLKITIQDNGVGIPPENLEKVFVREFTSGKPQGSGLGLYQAKKAVEWSGGKLAIESKIGEGTRLTISLPVEKQPSWITDQLSIQKGQSILIADDDPTILKAWQEKALAAKVSIREFPTIRALDEKIASLGNLEQFVFVLDQYASDAPEGITGTALIEKHALGSKAYLSTSEFDDPVIQEKVKALKTKLIPKARLSMVEIVVKTEESL